MSVVRQFLDTNVAVYAYDAAEPAKQAMAQRSSKSTRNSSSGP